MAEKVFVPPIKTQGIKTKIVPFIRQSMPLKLDGTWYEPFTGSGVVGFNLAPHRAVFADTNPHIIHFYQEIQKGNITPEVVRSYLEREGKQLAAGDTAYYKEVRDRFNRNHSPLDFLFLNRCCFNGMIRFNRQKEFNTPYGHRPERFSKGYITKITNQVEHVAELFRMHDWTFVCQSFEETIAMAGENDLVYCDPPYLGRNTDYYDTWDEQQEIALHEALVRSGAHYMLSTWDHTSFRENESLTRIWTDCQKQMKAHFYHLGGKLANRNSVVEALLTNYSLPEAQRI